MTRQSRRLRKAVNHGQPAISESCGKRRFRSREAAEKALSRLTAIRDPGLARTEQRAYQCPDCVFWHLTSSPEAWPGQAEAS